jgi:hypothetical protein
VQTESLPAKSFEKEQKSNDEIKKQQFKGLIGASRKQSLVQCNLGWHLTCGQERGPMWSVKNNYGLLQW